MLDMGGFVDAVVGFLSEAKVDPAVIENVKSTLTSAAGDLSGGGFKYAKTGAGAFGGSPTGVSLDGHHNRAQEVVAETLAGFVKDLHGFSDKVQRAADLVVDADDTSAADLKAKRMLIATQLDAAAHNTASDAAYHHAQGKDHPRYQPRGGHR